MKEISRQLARNKANKIPKEELFALIDRAKQGDLIARNTVVEKNLGLCVKVAYKVVYRGFQMHFEDCVQEGTLGLMRAIELFDTKRGYEFSTYAMWWIRQYIDRYLDNQSTLIRLPVHVRDIQNRYNQLKRMHTDKEEDFYLNLIAFEKNASVDHIIYCLTYKPTYVAIDKPNEKGKEIPRDLEYFMYDGYEDLKSINTAKLLDCLDHRERYILTLRMENWKLEAVAQMLNITRERVRQIQTRALLKIKALIKRVQRRQLK